MTLALLLAAQAAALPAVPASTVDYAKPVNWLCYPGRKDVCTTPLPTVAVNPNGYGSNGLSPVATDAGVDCFVVYPTVSRDTGMNSDLVPGASEETLAMQSQFARFASGCRMVAPMYRSMTLGAVAVAAAGGDVTKPAMLAYADVRVHTSADRRRAVEQDGIRCSLLADVVVDLARVLPPAFALAVADAALRAGTITSSELLDLAAAQRNPRGRRKLDWVLAHGDRRSESVGESVSRAVMEWCGFPAVDLQTEHRHQRDQGVPEDVTPGDRTLI